MKDQEFLIWIHERLTEIHGEEPTVDYMHKLRAVIRATDPEKVTPNMDTKNSLDELKKSIGI